jgi:hypothetical protein
MMTLILTTILALTAFAGVVVDVQSAAAAPSGCNVFAYNLTAAASGNLERKTAMKSHILACLLALTAVSGTVVPSQPDSDGSSPDAKTHRTCRITPLGSRYLGVATPAAENAAPLSGMRMEDLSSRIGAY